MASSGKAVSDQRAEEIFTYFQIHGSEATQQHFNIKHETIRRVCRQHRNKDNPKEQAFNKNSVLQKISEKYSESELRAIASGDKIIGEIPQPAKLDFSGTTFKFCSFTDTHFGSIYFHENLYESMLDECKKESVEAYLHSGDLTEGMNNRPGHIYEINKIGYEDQKEYAVKLLSELDKPFHAISGNHDRWFIKSNGANIVKNICKEINGNFLGHDVGRIIIKNSSIELWHGEDTSSYATSYRIQKLIEAYTGGTKPSVLLAGHTHKQIYTMERHVHAFSCGALSLQSAWMRSKRFANVAGFWIIKLTIDSQGHISKCKSEWFPFYQ